MNNVRGPSVWEAISRREMGRNLNLPCFGEKKRVPEVTLTKKRSTSHADVSALQRIGRLRRHAKELFFFETNSADLRGPWFCTPSYAIIIIDSVVLIEARITHWCHLSGITSSFFNRVIVSIVTVLPDG